MQPLCIGRNGLKIFALFAALIGATGAPLQAQENPSPIATPEPAPAKFTARIDTTFSQKPEFYEDDGTSLDITGRFGYKLNPSMTLGLLQGVTYNKRAAKESDPKIYGNDTLVRLSFPEFWKSADEMFKANARIQDMILANSLTSRRNTLKNAVGLQLSGSLTAGAFEAMLIADYTESFYAEKRNPDGQANTQRSVAPTVAVGYDVVDNLNVGVSYQYINRTNYDGKHSYLFGFNPEVAYKATKKLSIAIGLDTSDAYLKEFGGVEEDYLYQEDLSQYYLRLECSL